MPTHPSILDRFYHHHFIFDNYAAVVSNADLYVMLEAWCSARKAAVPSKIALGRFLAKRGHRQAASRSAGRMWHGLWPNPALD
jgi:hypothetical protein